MMNDFHINSVTYKEIIRQQSGWNIALESLEKEKSDYQKIVEKFRDRVWIFSGCGTSYYLAQVASSLFKRVAGIRTRAIPGSEVIIFPDLVFSKDDKYLFIPLSRSGKTTEIVKAAHKARVDYGIPSLAISCDYNSALSTQSDMKLKFRFEQEQSVVMTGSFTTMLASIIYLASLLAGKKSVVEKLREISELSNRVMTENEDFLRSVIFSNDYNDFVFLGQGPFYGIANEAALKMQEMSISFSQSYHSLEYRHGPMSTASEATLITILLCQDSKTFGIPLVEDLKELGASVLLIGDDRDSKVGKNADYQISVPRGLGDIFNPFLYMPLLQLLAFYKAISKKINPDNPKNLTAVVTLEI